MSDFEVALLDKSETDYHADKIDDDTPSLSASIATVLVEQSAAHAYARHPRLGGEVDPPTDAKDHGTIRHAFLTNTPPPVEILEFDNFRTNAAKEARDAARSAGLIPILSHKMGELKVQSMRIAESLEAAGYKLEGGLAEQTVAWHEESSVGSVLCRGRLDYLDVEKGEITDIKTVVSANPRACELHMIRYGSAIQEAAYTSAMSKLRPDLAGRIKFTFLFCETEPPYAVTPATSAGSMREYGESNWLRAVETWAKCLKTNHWPGYGPIQLHAPAWAVAQALEMEEDAA